MTSTSGGHQQGGSDAPGTGRTGALDEHGPAAVAPAGRGRWGLRLRPEADGCTPFTRMGEVGLTVPQKGLQRPYGPLRGRGGHSAHGPHERAPGGLSAALLPEAVAGGNASRGRGRTCARARTRRGRRQPATGHPIGMTHHPLPPSPPLGGGRFTQRL